MELRQVHADRFGERSLSPLPVPLQELRLRSLRTKENSAGPQAHRAARHRSEPSAFSYADARSEEAKSGLGYQGKDRFSVRRLAEDARISSAKARQVAGLHCCCRTPAQWQSPSAPLGGFIYPETLDQRLMASSRRGLGHQD